MAADAPVDSGDSKGQVGALQPDSPAADAAETAAEDGVPDAFELGREALLAKDYATAYRALREVAEQGHAQAQAVLAGMYLAGEGVAADDAEALRWYQRAADQGNAEAQAR
ncbi:MAG: SEL1-like repeat protein, partial [Betaproteobacteria bacterium]|nr:SEL1-like repeat protein [Betaproteobacteria bacterium]